MISNMVFDDVGLFDETLPACEDYDLWLRISALYPIFFLNEPLIIKHGGHDDQLSQQFIAIDRFRVKALLKALDNLPLSSNQYQKTVSMLIDKCSILVNGYKKRTKHKESQYYQSIIDQYREITFYDTHNFSFIH